MPGEDDRDERGCCLDAILREADGAGLDLRTPHGRAEAYKSLNWALAWRKRWDAAAYKLGNAALTAFALGVLGIISFGAFLWSGHLKVE